MATEQLSRQNTFSWKTLQPTPKAFARHGEQAEQVR
jgi:hypothetical protein